MNAAVQAEAIEWLAVPTLGVATLKKDGHLYVSAADEELTNATLRKHIIAKLTITFFNIIKSSFLIFQKFY